MKKLAGFSLVIGSMILAAMPAACSGTGIEKSVTGDMDEDYLISAGDYRAFIVHLGVEDKLNVIVRVGLGEEIDVYTMDRKDYDDYKAGAQLISYYSQYSKENLKYLEYPNPFTTRTEADFVVVIDNLGKTATGAQGRTDISCNMNMTIERAPPKTNGSSTQNSGMILGLVVAISIVVIAIVAIIFAAKQSSSKAPAPPPTGMYAQPGYNQPPQQYMPPWAPPRAPPPQPPPF